MELLFQVTLLLLLAMVEKSLANHNTLCIGLIDHLSPGSRLFRKAPFDTKGVWGPFSRQFDKAVAASQIKVYGIEVDGKALRGWFHVVLTVASNHQATAFVIQGVDDEKWNFGEFVWDLPGCTEPSGHKAQEVFPQWMFLPCGGASKYEQSMSWGVLYFGQPAKANSSHLMPSPPNLDRKEFHFNFRFPTSSCNQPLAFSIRAAINYEGLGNESVVTASSDLVRLQPLNFIGATDPIPRAGTYSRINCHQDLISMNLSYIRDLFNNGTAFPRSCTQRETRYDFKGRCDFGGSTLHTCPAKPKNSLQTYSDYLEQIGKRSKAACAPCVVVPPRPKTTLPTTTITSPTISTKRTRNRALVQEKKGLPLTHAAAKALWDSRIVHGVAMVIVSNFLLPLNIFITRYFKETFMKERMLHFRLWFFLHHAFTAFTLVFCIIGLSKMMRLRGVVGVNISLIGVLHRILGWTSVVSTFLVGVFGGWRILSPTLRAISIGAHWTLGMTIYLINYAQLILSAWIAGSPSAFDDITNKKDTSQYFVLVCGAWILTDLILHLAMSVIVVVWDKRLMLSKPRRYLPSLIPVLREHKTMDIPGSRIRKVMLVSYFSLSLFFTILLCLMLAIQDESDRGLGQMSCTHAPSGSILPSGADTTCNPS